ncbi:MAG: protein-L-isoaspartate(D-aspartate) O-methyltransferase, partial [Bryobacteraceae bacterium]
MRLWVLAALLAASQDPYAARRERMVRDHIEARQVRNRDVLKVMRATQRHLFVPDSLREEAYADSPLPIGHGQTISQPYVVAAMTELLDPAPHHKVLEIGAGSGYQAAVLSPLVARVFTIEILPELARAARARLERLGYRNIVVREGDGYRGWPDKGPFDAIIVTA